MPSQRGIYLTSSKYRSDGFQAKSGLEVRIGLCEAQFRWIATLYR